MYNWDKVDKYIGIIPDIAIAEAIGSTQAAVTSRRAAKGIPAYSSKSTGRCSLWHPVIADLIFNKYTDQEISDIFGISIQHVAARRDLYRMQQESESR